MKSIKPVVLVILDGMGMSPIAEGNAVYNAKTPFFDSLIKSNKSTLLHASGQEVGLSFGEIGNSEVGHLNLGTGRVVMQDLPRIDQTIQNGSFFENNVLNIAIENVNKNKSTLHLLGLVSNGGVHSHIKHLLALLDLAKKKNVKNVAIHIITDGRDTPAKKAAEFIKIVEEKIKNIGLGRIASLCGRFYAMDRDNHWLDRTKLAYDLFIDGVGETFTSAQETLDAGYKNGENDESLKPKIIDKNLTIKNKDSVVLFNFRIDRMKQLSKCLIDPDFKDFERGTFNKDLTVVTFTNYGFEPSKMVHIAFFSETLNNSLAEILSKSELNQFHIAETEKYAHVTYFFNGGAEKAFKSESRELIPSPRVLSYDQKPEMSAEDVANHFVSYFKKNRPEFSVINFANCDMVGHTGNYKATIRAVEVVDKCLNNVVSECIKNDSIVLVTADHGNAEQMINLDTHEIDKEHTVNPVPFIIVTSEKAETGLDKPTLSSMQPTGVLADVSPTILNLLEINKPAEMNGQSLKDII